MTPSRLPAELTGPLAAAVTLLAVAVLAVGVAGALAGRRRVGARLAEALRLALELMLAAGLLRLANARDLLALAGVAAVVALRQLIGLGVRLGGRVSEARGRT